MLSSADDRQEIILTKTGDGAYEATALTAFIVRARGIPGALPKVLVAAKCRSELTAPFFVAATVHRVPRG
jgi:hypothetical protein